MEHYVPYHSSKFHQILFIRKKVISMCPKYSHPQYLANRVPLGPTEVTVGNYPSSTTTYVKKSKIKFGNFVKYANKNLMTFPPITPLLWGI